MARIVRFHEYGDASVLKIENLDVPPPGADEVQIDVKIARVMEITRGVGARVVFDPVGGPSFIPLADGMARGGILLEYGALSTEPTPFPLFTVLGKSLTLKGYLNGEITNDDAALERAKAFITSGLTSRQLKPVIARTFHLEQIQGATRFLESNTQIGKVVVKV